MVSLRDGKVVVHGVSNTQVELRLERLGSLFMDIWMPKMAFRTPEGEAPGLEHVRVKDVSSNGTGMQELI